MTLSLRTTVAIDYTYQRARGNVPATVTLQENPYSQIKQFIDGTSGTDVADQLYRTPLVGQSIAAGATINLDLLGLASGDGLGDTLSIVHVKGLYLYAYATNLAGIRVGGAASNPWQGPLSASATTTVEKDGELYWRHPGTGWVVTAGTADILKILNLDGSNASLFDLFIWGSSL